MPHEVVTTPSTVTVLSANLPGLVCTSEIEREPIDAHAPPSADAAMTRPMTKLRVRPIDVSPLEWPFDSKQSTASTVSLRALRQNPRGIPAGPSEVPRADRETASEERRCQRLPDSSPLGDPPRLATDTPKDVPNHQSHRRRRIFRFFVSFTFGRRHLRWTGRPRINTRRGSGPSPKARRGGCIPPIPHA